LEAREAAIVCFSALGEAGSACSLAPMIGRLLNSGGISFPISEPVFCAFARLTLGMVAVLFMFCKLISTLRAKAFIAAWFCNFTEGIYGLWFSFGSFIFIAFLVVSTAGELGACSIEDLYEWKTGTPDPFWW
jgi:hypothetical protein